MPIGFNALMDPSQIGTGIQNAFQMGMENRRQIETRRAMGDYVQNQNADTAKAVAVHDPRTGMQLMDREADRAAAERKAVMEQSALMAKLVGHARDETTYRQALGVAQQMGWDVSQAPATFAEAQQSGFLAKYGLIAQVMLDKGPEAFSTAGKIAMDRGLQPGTPQFQEFVLQYTIADQAKPYTGARGETRLYQPNFGQPQSAPQPGAVEDGYRFKGGDPADQSNWEPVNPTIANTPAPQLNASGAPAILTPQQYQAIVNAKGKAATDAWMAQNNVRVGGR